MFSIIEQYKQMNQMNNNMNQFNQMNINMSQTMNEIKNLYLSFKMKIKEKETVIQIQCKSNDTIKEVINKFYCKICDASKYYYFFYNGEKIINNELTFDEYGINDNDEIIVVEKNDINQINEILKTNQNSSNSNKMSIPKGNKRNLNLSPSENQQNLIQLQFNSPSGLKSILTFNKKSTISDALGKYCQSLGLVLQKAQYLSFLFNGCKLSINDKRFLGGIIGA